MLFSIVIPVYNVKTYLENCVNSVLKQGFADYELILVDDGSTDSSGEMCDKFSESDPRVKVIHKSNGGLSSARNRGMDQAQGEFVFFLDGDDLLVNGILQVLNYKIREKVNVQTITGNIYTFVEKKNELKVDNDISEFVDAAENNLVKLSELMSCGNETLPWRAYQTIYRLDFLKLNALRFDESNVGAEDCMFFNQYITCVTNSLIIKDCFVKYRVARSGSIINTPSEKSIAGQLAAFFFAFNKWKDKNNMPLTVYYAKRLCNIVFLIPLLSKKSQQKRLFSKISSDKRILKYLRGNLKYTIVRLFWQIFGVESGTHLIFQLREVL